jgi:C4-dicarboxylate transporter DctM subunit
MKKKNYDPAFSAALAAAAGAVGPIIPPSIPMIIYAVIANTSVASLFLGGIVPGALYGLILMVYSYLYARRRNYPTETVPLTFHNFITVSKRGIFPLLMPVIIVGGIFSGVFTATESAVVAVVYSFIVARFIYHEVTWRNLPKILASTARSTASIMYIIGFATFLGWVITSEQIPQKVAEAIFSLSGTPWIIISMLNGLMLVLGCFIDPVSILILICPIALPIIKQIGMDPVHFGVILTVNISIGALYPPVGELLFVTSRIGKVSYYDISKAIMPMVILLIGLLFLVSLVPDTVLYLPRLFAPGN